MLSGDPMGDTGPQGTLGYEIHGSSFPAGPGWGAVRSCLTFDPLAIKMLSGKGVEGTPPRTEGPLRGQTMPDMVMLDCNHSP